MKNQQQFHRDDSDAHTVSRPGIARRRLIKAGAAAIPVAATLVSRPAFAALGRTPSAWGSDILNTNSSVQPGNQSLIDDTWRVSDWASNSSRGALARPWNAIEPRLSLQPPPDMRNDDWFKQITLRQLFSGLGGSLVIPSGSNINASSDASAAEWFTEQGSNFAAILLTAQLNRLLLQSVQDILTLDQVQQMASGSFTPNAPGQDAWDSTKIARYLDQNYIVRTT